MLTRIRLRGFKSFLDAEVRFGPFTCIAGANGSGKSNLFDALQFMRDLTEFRIIEAASRVRDAAGRSGDARAIFLLGEGQPPDMQLEADFLVPDLVHDDFNREARPAATFLRYALAFRYVAASGKAAERIELIKEVLEYIPKGDARSTMGFPATKLFRNSAVHNKRRGAQFISTDPGEPTLRLHQEGGLGGGRPFTVAAARSDRTIVGGITTNDYPTVLAARREMQSWTLLQLEPSALRQPDAFSAHPHLTANGAHMAATLVRLGAEAEVSNRLASLLDDVASVFVDRDESRRTYTLNVGGRNGIAHPARSLSDGTLRFLALAILAADTESARMICLEEPENGIHPSRIPAILDLLREMAVDSKLAVDSCSSRAAQAERADEEGAPGERAASPAQQELFAGDAEPGAVSAERNPLRQVIVNTHSPAVVSALDIGELLLATLVRQKGSSHTVFQHLADSWRAQLAPGQATISRGALLAYLGEPQPATAGEGARSAAEAVQTVGAYVRQDELPLSFAALQR